MRSVPVLSTALINLLRLDGRSMPDSPDRVELLERVAESRWLRFALGVTADEPMPMNDDAAIAVAADDFGRDWQSWMGYRRSLIELSPPGATAPVKFRIEGAAAAPPEFPASTFAILTAWNPGGVERGNPALNRRANERLAAHLDARMVERWPAINAPGSRWREESFAVLGLDLDEAWRMGEAFQQRAIYYIDRGKPLLVARRRGRVVKWEGTLCAA
ncbi:MAG: hypothetical protein JWN44_5251 [Myxococcales bacterium]|nr:hypothetical protein [Myxococcales bacterium]